MQIEQLKMHMKFKISSWKYEKIQGGRGYYPHPLSAIPALDYFTLQSFLPDIYVLALILFE